MKPVLLMMLVIGCGSGDSGIENLPKKQLVPREAEVVSNLDAIAKRANSIFHDTKAFPIGTTAELPARNGDVLASGCCGSKSSGTTEDNKCPVSTAWASDPVWKTLGFSIAAPSLYRYKYESADGKSYTATATGDADCDSKEATFRVHGTIDASTKPHAELDLPLKGTY
jgi:hypothetical protein